MLFIDNVFRTLAYIMLWMIMNCFYYFLSEYSLIKYPMLTLAVTWFILWIVGLVLESFHKSPRAWSWHAHAWQLATICLSWACMLIAQSTIFQDEGNHPEEHVNKYGFPSKSRGTPLLHKQPNPQCDAGAYALHIKQIAPIFVFLLTTIVRKHYYGSLRRNYWYTLGILVMIAAGAMLTMGIQTQKAYRFMDNWKTYVSTAIWLVLRASWLVSLDSLRRSWPTYTLTQLYASIGWIMSLFFGGAFFLMEYSTLMSPSTIRNARIYSDADHMSHAVVVGLSIIFFALFFNLNLLVLRSLESVVHYSIFVTVRDVFWALGCVTFAWSHWVGATLLFFGIAAYETKVGKSIIAQWNQNQASQLKLHQESSYISDEDSDAHNTYAYTHLEDKAQ